MSKQNKEAVTENSENIEILDNTEASATKKKRRGLRILLWIIGIIIALVVIAGVTAFILTGIGKNKLTDYEDVVIEVPDIAENENDGKTVFYNGEKYILNENIITILGMGVDRNDFADEDIETYGTNGQADSMFVIALDSSTGKTKIISVSRETMVDIDMYSEGGSYIGNEKKQICLAYAYGDGREFSCENVEKAVSRVFYGLPVNSYFAIDFGAVSKLNDAVGGITVTSLSDFHFQSGKSVKEGEKVTLEGNEAVYYVRKRSMTDIDANTKRVKRQMQYIRTFADKAFSKTKENITEPIKLFNVLSDDDDMVTNIDLTKVSYLTECILKNNAASDIDFININGESKLGEDGHAEFYADETEFFEMILDVFYTKAE